MIDPRRTGDPNRFIKVIEEARVRAGLTQAEMARMVGAGPSSYRMLANGRAKRGGTVGSLDVFANALGLEFVLVTKEQAENIRLAQELERLGKIFSEEEKSNG